MKTDQAKLNQTDMMGTESMGRLLARLAIPAVVAQLINLLYNIVDRIYIGHIPGVGAAALTGLGLFVPILMLITAFAMLIGAGGAPLAAIRLGQGDKTRAEHLMGTCFSALVALGLVLTAALYAAAPELLIFFGASAATLPYALEYARIYILGTVVTMIALGMNVFISAQGFARTSMLTTVIGAVINTALDPLLIFTFGMGVRGAAIATVLSQVVSALWILFFLRGKKSTIRLRRQHLRIDLRVLLRCVSLGVSNFVMLSTESLLSIAFNRSLAGYGGDLAVGAMTIISSVNSLILMPLQGITQGGQPIISYNFGARKNDRVRSAFRLIITSAVSYAVFGWLCVQLFTRPLAGIFTEEPQLMDYAAGAMRIYFSCIFSLGFQLSCQQGFLALGQARLSLMMAALRKLVLLIPLILILPQFFSDKVFAVFLSEPVSDVIAAVVTCAVFFTRFDGILQRGPDTDKQPAPAREG